MQCTDADPFGPNEGPPLPDNGPNQDPPVPNNGNQNNQQQDPELQSTDLYSSEYKSYPESGYAIVINNKTFLDRDLEDRVGTDRDASNLLNRFSEFGYHTEHISEKNKRDLLEELQRIASMDHSQHTALFCAILTHGNQNGLWAKDRIMRLSELTEIFDAENCPTLINKPKVFIIQACRGDEEGRPTVIRVVASDRPEADASTDPEDMEIPGEEAGAGAGQEARSIDILTIPAIMDFLIVHATVEGTKAWRNTQMGTPFITNFCEEMENLRQTPGQEEDIYTLLNRVNLAVAVKFQALSGGKQMPCFVSTLTKTFKLKSPE